MYECNICGRKFRNKKDFDEHVLEHSSCQSILEMKICSGDEVIISVGRYMYRGSVVSVKGSSIIVTDGHRTISIKKSKINMIEKIGG